MRKSGILMHISSLPHPYGIGTMGKCAYDFVDFLCEAGQSYWQILPLSPTGYGDSPYQALSTFAGNHYFIDPDRLIEMGLLLQSEVDSVCWSANETRVDFGCLYENRTALLHLAFARFVPDARFEQFVAENSSWLEDYALFVSLKELFGGAPWQSWQEDLRIRKPEALARHRQQLSQQIRFQQFLQYLFFDQWESLKRYARKKGIRFIGDVPIYVPLDSADVWANPRLFQLDDHYRPTAVAGCPPDSFSADGQLWGNPLYNWQLMGETGYRWWIRRLSAAARMYDVIRLDHFRGFESYWSIPAGDKTAAGGRWVQGPSHDFIRCVRENLPELEFIAEDLGFVTGEVRQLQEASGYPGMKVMQFAFDSRESGDYLPHNYPVNSVCYCGTHDNMTMAQWFQEADVADVALATAYLGLNTTEGYIRGVIRGCMGSVSKLCIIQMQDYLELGAEARMNFPGTLSAKNWTWRAKPGFAAKELAKRIYTLTERYGRL